MPHPHLYPDVFHPELSRTGRLGVRGNKVIQQPEHNFVLRRALCVLRQKNPPPVKLTLSIPEGFILFLCPDFIIVSNIKSAKISVQDNLNILSKL